MLILLGFGGTNRAIAESFSPCIALDDSFTQKSQDALGNLLLPSESLSEVLVQNPEASIITTPGFHLVMR